MQENIYSEKSPIFLTKDGGYIQVLSITEREKRLLEALGLKEIIVTTYH